jgi:hypothetical protein
MLLAPVDIASYLLLLIHRRDAWFDKLTMSGQSFSIDFSVVSASLQLIGLLNLGWRKQKGD